ncbi:MAG: hypothetical protein ACTSRB_03450 [Candidatus Helarchaeota archaeon]
MEVRPSAIGFGGPPIGFGGPPIGFGGPPIGFGGPPIGFGGPAIGPGVGLGAVGAAATTVNCGSTFCPVRRLISRDRESTSLEARSVERSTPASIPDLSGADMPRF